MVYGSNGRIALAILDSDYTIEPDVRRMLPPGIELHASRIVYPHGVTAQSLAVAVEGLEQAVVSLLPVRPSALIWACTSASFVHGRAGNDRIVTSMRACAGTVAVDTAAGAVVQALRAAGVRRPAVGSPYSREINRRLEAFLRESGFEPVRVAELYADDIDDYGLQNITSDDLADFLFDLDVPECDGLLLSCTGLPCFDLVPRVERDIDKPVVASNAAIAWWAMHLGGMAARPCGSQRLFRMTPVRHQS